MITDSYDAPINFGSFFKYLFLWMEAENGGWGAFWCHFPGEGTSVGSTYPAPNMILASKELRTFPREKTSAYTDVSQVYHAKWNESWTLRPKDCVISLTHGIYKTKAMSKESKAEIDSELQTTILVTRGRGMGDRWNMRRRWRGTHFQL